MHLFWTKTHLLQLTHVIRCNCKNESKVIFGIKGITFNVRLPKNLNWSEEDEGEEIWKTLNYTNCKLKSNNTNSMYFTIPRSKQNQTSWVTLKEDELSVSKILPN